MLLNLPTSRVSKLKRNGVDIYAQKMSSIDPVILTLVFLISEEEFRLKMECYGALLQLELKVSLGCACDQGFIFKRRKTVALITP